MPPCPNTHHDTMHDDSALLEEALVLIRKLRTLDPPEPSDPWAQMEQVGGAAS